MIQSWIFRNFPAFFNFLDSVDLDWKNLNCPKDGCEIKNMHYALAGRAPGTKFLCNTKPLQVQVYSISAGIIGLSSL